MDGSINLDALNSGLKSIKYLRNTVLELFKIIGDGAKSTYDEEDRLKFVNDLQGPFKNVLNRMRELETAVTLLGSPNAPLNLGNSGVLSQDSMFEKTHLYSELVKSHRWFDRMYELCNQTHTIFNQNSLKRTNFDQVALKRLRIKQSAHNVPPQQVDHTTAQLMRFFSDYQIQVLKPYGASTIILVSVPRTLKVLIMMRGLLIEWVLVKGYNEDFYADDDRLDIWTGSKYLVFQKVTEHANAAMLHFYSPNMPDLAVRSFLLWLRSYGSLFSQQCRKCGNRLHNNMPPTWRDVRNLDPYHEACKP